MQDKPISEEEKPTFVENKTLEEETKRTEIYDDSVRKTPIFSFPTLIRVRATDREGNTIEVTY